MDKPQYNFGDLVRVNGYYPRIFEVDGRRIENWQYPDEEWHDIVYEVFDVLSCDYIECCEDDITLVAEADKAEAYLEANPPDYEAQAPVQPDWMKFMFGGDETMKNFGEKPKEPRKPTARELSAQLAKEQKEMRKRRGEQIDNLLDLRNWASEMLAKTNDEAYGDRVMAIDCELKMLTEDE
jgi:hypothetical protein